MARQQLFGSATDRGDLKMQGFTEVYDMRCKHRHTVFGQDYNAGTVVGLEEFNSLKSLCIIDATITPYTEELRATCTYLSGIRKRHELALEWLGHWTHFTREVPEQHDFDATHPPHLFLFALALQCKLPHDLSLSMREGLCALQQGGRNPPGLQHNVASHWSFREYCPLPLRPIVCRPSSVSSRSELKRARFSETHHHPAAPPEEATAVHLSRADHQFSKSVYQLVCSCLQDKNGRTRMRHETSRLSTPAQWMLRTRNVNDLVAWALKTIADQPGGESRGCDFMLQVEALARQAVVPARVDDPLPLAAGAVSVHASLTRRCSLRRTDAKSL